jgi:sugar transferase (PEP-CTERM/EpsH1 system associated)
LKPNLIYLCHRMPWPPIKGEKIHTWHVLNHLAQHFTVHLGVLVDEPEDMAHIPRMQAVCGSVGAFRIHRVTQLLRALRAVRPGRPLQPGTCASPALAAWVDACVGRMPIAAIFISSVAMAPYALHRHGPRLILDAQDIDSEKWQTYAASSKWPMRLLWAREARTLRAYERHAAARCDVTFFVSAPEAQRFAELAPESAARVRWFDNGVELDHFNPAHNFPTPFAHPGPALVFTGHMQYRPNVDAVIWFATEVMPRLRSRGADAHFWIVGAAPTSSVQALAKRAGVHVTGQVADTRPYLAHAAAVVCPLRIARGIQNKVLEAMAMGKTVVLTPQALEGIEAREGAELLVAADAQAFADTVCAALEQPDPAIGHAARACVEAGYGWTARLAPLMPLLEGEVARTPASPAPASAAGALAALP